MLRSALSLSLGLALVATTLAFRPDRAKATHTLAIEYEQARGDLRPATLAIAPVSEDVPALWEGPLRAVSVLTTDGRWIILDRFLSSGHSTGHHAQTRGMLPTGETVMAVLVTPQRGPTFGWKVEEGESYTEVEWTYYDGAGDRVRSAPCAARDCFAHLADPVSPPRVNASGFRVEIEGIVAEGGGNGI